MNSYFIFLKHFADIGQLARQNLKQQKSQEFYNEVFKIARANVKGNRGKEAMIDKFSKLLAGKVVPEHVQKIYVQESQRIL